MMIVSTAPQVVSELDTSVAVSVVNGEEGRRQGTERAWDQRFAENFRMKASWTWLDATYRSNVYNGNRMPGISRTSFGYVPEEGGYTGTEVRYMGDIMADDENTAKAPSYTRVGLFTGYKFNY